ncbi:MAG: hypothetical protein C4582_07740 [Desulfobacteraceae bacterium]|jgi:hypothetical protein|nr:MAG: hypothetical protein C4582_07740 [Desulfobacteraceae bacterium]
MKKNHMTGYSRKHPPGIVVRRDVAEAVVREAYRGKLDCAIAFKIADQLGVLPQDVGLAADLKDVSIVKCQLGLYGYRDKEKRLIPAKSVSFTLEDAIRSCLTDGKLPCKKAWDIAFETGLRKTDVSSACEALGIKISRCQLGAF